MSRALSREDIRELLVELAAELHSRGISADVFLVGGAAMTVAYDARRATRDLDAVFAPAAAVREAAAAVAERRGLPADWLNDAVKGFLPGQDRAPRRFFTTPSLRVDVASPEYLLAMKLFSSRVEADFDDVMFLYRLLGFTTVDEGLNLVSNAYADRPIHPKVQYLVAEVVQALAAQPGADPATQTPES